MTIKEKVDRAMKGCSWQEAEEIGVAILGKLTAFYLQRDGDFDFVKLMQDIVEYGDKWIQEEGGASYVAVARAGIRDAEKKGAAEKINLSAKWIRENIGADAAVDYLKAMEEPL